MQAWRNGCFRKLSVDRCHSCAARRDFAARAFSKSIRRVGLPAVVERIQIQEKSEVRTYSVIQNLEGLIALVQFGTLEFHAWGSRAADVEQPDRLVFDLDPDPSVAWKDVVNAARTLRRLLLSQRLRSFLKTTGGKGLHLVVPIAPKHNWAEAKAFARQIADSMVAAEPDKYIATMSKAARRGKIFIDYSATNGCPPRLPLIQPGQNHPPRFRCQLPGKNWVS